jgi:hypothetical protein
MALLVGVLLYVFASRFLFFLGPFGGWAAIIVMAVLYTRWNADAILRSTSPVGYGIGICTILGAVGIEAGILVNIIISFVIVGAAPVGSGASAVAGLSVFSGLIHLLYAPIIGALVGLFGGLLGSATIPRRGDW